MAFVAVLVKRPLARQFYRALVGFRAGISEEYALHARLLAQQPGELRGGGAVVEVGSMGDHVQLGCDRPFPLLIAVTEYVYGDTAAKVDVFLAVFVPGSRAFALHKSDIEAVVCIRKI